MPGSSVQHGRSNGEMQIDMHTGAHRTVCCFCVASSNQKKYVQMSSIRQGQDVGACIAPAEGFAVCRLRAGSEEKGKSSSAGLPRIPRQPCNAQCDVRHRCAHDRTPKDAWILRGTLSTSTVLTLVCSRTLLHSAPSCVSRRCVVRQDTTSESVHPSQQTPGPQV